VDYWDGVALIGVGLVVSGVALVSVPAALVLSGVGLIGIYTAREIRSVPRQPAERPVPAEPNDDRP
jgi:xanthosine utilization system XapX-like protein